MSYTQAMRFNRKHPKGTRPFGKGPVSMYATETKHTPEICKHNEMIENKTGPGGAWKCAKCGYIYSAETKHTPGPWTCEFTACDKDGIKQVIAGDACFPRVGNQPLICVAECKEKNAQLIAAAPALLEVCRAMATEIDRFCAKNNIGGGFGVTHKAWAVIAAAG